MLPPGCGNDLGTCCTYQCPQAPSRQTSQIIFSYVGSRSSSSSSSRGQMERTRLKDGIYQLHSSLLTPRVTKMTRRKNKASPVMKEKNIPLVRHPNGLCLDCSSLTFTGGPTKFSSPHSSHGSRRSPGETEARRSAKAQHMRYFVKSVNANGSQCLSSKRVIIFSDILKNNSTDTHRLECPR